MRKIASNSFGDGMVKDLEPLTTPNTVLTDLLNGTLITYNGNEYVLQNDMGNCKVERAKLNPGFIPLGVKEHGGIIYIASYNPDTKECEVGSFPSPERDIEGTNYIEGQTGLRDGVFNRSDYSIPTNRGFIGNPFVPIEKLSKIQKLNEEEVLQLNPGDMYITTYQITGDITQAAFPDYFSVDENDKKVFQINFYKVSDSNDLTRIPNNEVKTISHRPIIDEDEYAYYTQTSSGSVAVEVAMNTITYFDSSIRETSKRIDTNKSLRIEGLGLTDSSLSFKGMRIDMLKNDSETATYYVEKSTPNTDKISVSIDELEENDYVRCEVTPYTEYGYVPKFTQNFNLTLGQGSFGGDVNSIFKWRLNEQNKRIELDFDFRHDTDNRLGMYLEFYDTWSNISTIKTIPSPSIYGPMRLSIPLVDEPKTQVFSSNSHGGIPSTKVRESTDPVNIPHLVNAAKTDGKKLIRIDDSLRINHFYLVRICGYETVSGEVKHYDIYRGLYTNSAYNELYETQTSSSGIQNFNNIPYPLEKVAYEATLNNQGDNTNLIAEEVTYNTDKLTTKDGLKYPYSLSAKPTEGTVVASKNYEYTKNYSVSITAPSKYTYNEIANGLLSLNTNEGSVVNNERVIDISNQVVDPIKLTDNLEINSTGSIVIPKDLTVGTHTVKLKLNTQRGIESSINTNPINGTVITKSLRDFMYKPESAMGIYLCGGAINATIAYQRSRRGKSNSSPGSRTICNHFSNKSGVEVSMIDATVNNTDNGWTVLNSVSPGNNDSSELNMSLIHSILPSDYQFFTLARSHYTLEGGTNHTTLFNVLFTQRGNPRVLLFPLPETFRPGNLNPRLREYLNDFEVTYVEPTPTSTDTYWADNFTFYGTDARTEATDLNLSIKSEWDKSTKRYVFEAIINSLGNNIRQFSTANVNSLITDAINRSDHELVETAPLLEDNGFIPFMDSTVTVSESTFILNLGDLTLNLGTDETLVSTFRKAKEFYDKEYVSVNPSSGDLVPITLKGNASDSKDKRDFIRYFNYSVAAKELVLTNVPTLVSTKARSRASGDTWLRSFDVTKEVLTLDNSRPSPAGTPNRPDVRP